VAVDVAFTEAPDPVANPSPAFTTDVVERALVDAEQLLSGSGPISAVDRVHTALHGYLSGAGTGEPRGRVQICHPRRQRLTWDGLARTWIAASDQQRADWLTAMPAEAQLFAPQARPETTHSIPGDAGRDHRAFAGSEAWSDFGAPKRRNNRPLIHPGRCNHLLAWRSIAAALGFRHPTREQLCS
jgi:hypothetical protein